MLWDSSGGEPCMICRKSGHHCSCLHGKQWPFRTAEVEYIFVLSYDQAIYSLADGWPRLCNSVKVISQWNCYEFVDIFFNAKNRTCNGKSSIPWNLKYFHSCLRKWHFTNLRGVYTIKFSAGSTPTDGDAPRKSLLIAFQSPSSTVWMRPVTLPWKSLVTSLIREKLMSDIYVLYSLIPPPPGSLSAPEHGSGGQREKGGKW